MFSTLFYFTIIPGDTEGQEDEDEIKQSGKLSQGLRKFCIINALIIKPEAIFDLPIRKISLFNFW